MSNRIVIEQLAQSPTVRGRVLTHVLCCNLSELPGPESLSCDSSPAEGVGSAVTLVEEPVSTGGG